MLYHCSVHELNEKLKPIFFCVTFTSRLAKLTWLITGSRRSIAIITQPLLTLTMPQIRGQGSCMQIEGSQRS